MNGWMTWKFTSFSTVIQFSTIIQSYQDDEQDNERLCATEPRLWLKRSQPQARLKPGTARSVGKCL